MCRTRASAAAHVYIWQVTDVTDMYDHILFPTDGSDAVTDVFESALDIATAHGATVSVLNVADTARDSVAQIQGNVVDALEREGEQQVAELAETARERGVSVETDVLQGDPAETIADYTREYDVDLVVMPTHGRTGLNRLLLGSVTEAVINSAAVPVLVVNPDTVGAFEYPPQSVLLPTDGSRGSDLALSEAIDVATETTAALHLFHVVETANLGFDVRSVLTDAELAKRGETTLDDPVATAESAGIEPVTSSVALGKPYREILDYIKEQDIDLVTVGTQGKTDFSRYVLGSVTTKLLRTSPVPVLLVREADERRE